MGMCGQRYTLDALIPGMKPGTHCVKAGWVGPRAGLDG